MRNINEYVGPRFRNASSLITLLFVLVFLLSGCGSGDTIYVALGSPDSFGSVTDLEVVTIADLDLPSEASAAIDSIYEKFDGLIKDKNDQDQLIRLIASRDAEICATIVQLMPTSTLLDRGLPMRVCRDSMADLDAALFDDEEEYENSYCGWIQ